MVWWLRGIAGIGACAVVMAAAGNAQAAPHHAGFTGDLGLGIGVTSYPMTSYVSCAGTVAQCAQYDVGEHHSTAGKFGLAPLSLSLGGFLTPKVALLFRATGTSFSDYGTDRLNAFYGAVVEVWPHDRFFVGGGPGIGYYGTNPLQGGFQESETAFALSARAGAALIGGHDHDLTLSLEGISGFYAEQTIFSGALIAAWKWY